MTSKRQPRSPVHQLDSIRRVLDGKRRAGIPKSGKLTPWREIAKDYLGVPPGTLCSVSKGRDPHKPSIRAVFGLPVLAPAPVCPVHHKVHSHVHKPRQNYYEWRSKNMDKLLKIVAWADPRVHGGTQADQRAWWHVPGQTGLYLSRDVPTPAAE